MCLLTISGCSWWGAEPAPFTMCIANLISLMLMMIILMMSMIIIINLMHLILMAIKLTNIMIMKLILVSSPLQVFSWLGDQLHSSLRVPGNLAMELFKLWQQQNIICTRDKISSLGICEIFKIALENLFPTMSSASTGIGLSAPSRSTWYYLVRWFSSKKVNIWGSIIKSLRPLEEERKN